MEKTLKDRKDVDESITWDLSAIYSTEDEYNLAVEELQGVALEVERDYKGRMNTPNNINDCLDKMKKVGQLMYLAGSYAELSVSVDHTNNENQERYISY